VPRFRPSLEHLENRLAPSVSILGSSSTQIDDSGTDPSTTLSNYTVDAGSNRLLVVSTGYNGTSGTTTVTFNGTPMTPVVHQGGILNAFQDLWVLTLGTSSTATTANVVATYPGPEVDYVTATTFAGVDQTTPAFGSGG
jgi:hypothetical protein